MAARQRGRGARGAFGGRGLKEDTSAGVHPSILKQARRSGQLNLSGRSLTEVPDTVWRINIDVPEEAKVVTLDNTEDRWWEQVELTKLILASNAITHLGDGLAQLPALTVLDIHDNRLASLPDALGELENLQKIDISRNQLHELPACIARLSNLVSLHAENNKLTQLCPEVVDCRKLEELDVSHNELEELPKYIGLLSCLFRLNVSNNNLSRLPPEIGAMNCLRYFDATHNRLTQLPEEFGCLRKLEQLYLRHNRLAYLPILHSCENLKELHLGNNAIMGITAEHLQHLGSITFLDLRDNKVVKLPEEIILLQGLERLDLTNNDISALPYALGTINSLKAVVLDGNPMKSIRRDIIMRGTVELKKYLRSRMEEPESAPTTVATNKKESVLPAAGDTQQNHDMHQFKAMDFGGQKCSEVPAELWETAMQAGVTNVNLSKNSFTQLPSNLILLEGTLTELNMGFNKISTLSPDIGLFPKLVFLDLRGNGMSSLPAEISSLQALRELTLSTNRFTEIPPPVYELKKLEILFMNENQVSTVDPAGVQRLGVLGTLDLQNNNISQVAPELGNCTSIKSLQLGGNPCRNPRPALIAKGTNAIMEYLRSRIIT
ncbi:leucine-rich repeat-containing protein 40-like [Littorina saxatilis]|uniref:Disease resistance R13L4/SHOC-2-like LRR domain-containing protein n=1 Tax=Littorina saxatilis TaxID=31220 RepID=A0AAN9B8Q7_9CAEN